MHDARALIVAVAKSAVRHRIAGHSAEIAFFAMVALVPATVTVGGAMHLVALVAGPESQAREETAAVGTIRFLLGPGLGDSVIVPFVRAQLAQQEGGLAVGGLLVTWWLCSHLFNSTSHALDATYGVAADRRGTPVVRLIAMAYALAAVVVLTVTLAVMSAVPLGFTDERGQSMLVPAAEIVWTVLRWPLLAGVLALTLTCIYRFSPDVRHSLRDCWPGALVAVALLIVMIAGFRLYLQLGFGAPTGVVSSDPRIVLIGHAVASVVATAFFVYFASYAVLLGAEVNSELIRRKPRGDVQESERRPPSLDDVRRRLAPLLMRNQPRTAPDATTSASTDGASVDAEEAQATSGHRPAYTTTGRAVRVRSER